MGDLVKKSTLCSWCLESRALGLGLNRERAPSLSLGAVDSGSVLRALGFLGVRKLRERMPST